MDLKPEIDSSRCTGCGKCIDICPKDVLFMDNGVACVNENECMLCSHCYAVCAFDAVSFSSALKDVNYFTFDYNEQIFSRENISPGKLVNIFRSRRSIRKYTEEPVSDQSIRDLVEFAVTAPSGSNFQEWEFTVLNGREKVWDFAQLIKKFFIKINRLAANPVVRILSVPFMGRSLINYYRDHYDTVQMAIEESEKGTDLLFHGAPSLIVVHGSMEGSTPVEDGTYAAYNICMLAHYMGLGTCLIGFAVEAMNRDSELREYMDIPDGNRIHAVIALGNPDIRFFRHSLRKEYSVDFV